MTVKNLLISRFYEKASGWVTTTPTAIYYVESPAEQALSDKVPQEGILRIFLTEEEAEAYEEGRKEYEDLVVKKVSLKTLWKSLPDIESMCRHMWDCTLKIEYSTMHKLEPVSLDTLHGNYILLS